MASGQNLTSLLSTFLTALHILHSQDVLDAYGHLSVRNPAAPAGGTFFMSRNMPPALAAGRHDIVEYHVANASAVNPSAPNGFIERVIHSEIYKRFTGVNCVVHSHAPAVIPFTMSDVPLRAVVHLAGFLGSEVPVFDISKYYITNDTQDLLVKTVPLGAALAEQFGSPSSNLSDHAVVLMQNHGFTTAAADIKTAVFQAVYAQVNAKVLSDTLNLESAFPGTREKGVVYMTHQQIIDSWKTNIGTTQRPWDLWVRQVKVNPLYANELDADV